MKNKRLPWIAGGMLLLWALNSCSNAAPEPTTLPLPAVVASRPTTPSATPADTESPLQASPTSLPFTCLQTGYPPEIAIVTQIIDGDTIYVELDGREYSVRYIGIDAPEMDSSEPGAPEATQRNAELVAGKTVTLVRDVSDVDVYDRLLRYVLIDSTFVNYELVHGGFAFPKQYPPDTACHETLDGIQGASRSGPSILLPTEPAPTLEPQPTPAIVTGCPAGCFAEQSGCSIKGNISMEGEKIYHLPGMDYYSKTKISPEYGERWFCSEEEAVANGWRKAKR